MSEQKDLKELIREVLLAVHPVGSLFFTSDDRNPDVILFGGGYSKWKRIEGRFIYGASENRPIGQTGGEESHVLTGSEMPAHSHDRGSMEITGNFPTWDAGWKEEPYGAFYYDGGGQAQREGTTNIGWDYRVGFQASRAWSGSTSVAGSSRAHNNLPPFAVYAIWERIE